MLIQKPPRWHPRQFISENFYTYIIFGWWRVLLYILFYDDFDLVCAAGVGNKKVWYHLPFLCIFKKSFISFHLIHPMSSSSSNPSPKWIYDVFLSYCVNDSAKSFSSLLYTSLTEAGVHVFRDDDDELRSGDQITPSALHAIGVSRISIIVFSRNYGASEWCLQELEKIMECRRTIFQNVFPLFYEVDRSDVSRQQGAFGEAFDDLVQRITVEEDTLKSWRRALRKATKMLEFSFVDLR